MAGFALGKIMETKSDNFKVGDIVEGDLGWQNYSLKSENEIEKAHIISSLSLHMSVLGITGRTAYFGMKLANLKKKDTVLISAAAGAVGNVAGQIAKIKGCRVIGITSSEEKAKWLTQDLGFDGVVNYKNGNLVKDLKELCPNKIDVYFDNVGGHIFETIMFGMNNHGRVICCGALSQYDQAPPKNGPRGIPGIIVTKRLSLRGFIVMDFDDQKEEANKQLLEWINNKELLVAEDIVEGLENAPSALVGLLNGENKGKRIVKI
jgi:NADPH-dependent curcumin reductase CurA